MVSIEDSSMDGGGYALKQMIWNAARDTIRWVVESSKLRCFWTIPYSRSFLSRSEWTGQQLAECSLYGVRIYKTGAILATHVDSKFRFFSDATTIYVLFPYIFSYHWFRRLGLPLVSSAIINVDQDVDEPWYVAHVRRIATPIVTVLTRMRFYCCFAGLWKLLVTTERPPILQWFLAISFCTSLIRFCME